jgi:hypothetical protein
MTAKVSSHLPHETRQIENMFSPVGNPRTSIVKNCPCDRDDEVLTTRRGPGRFSSAPARPTGEPGWSYTHAVSDRLDAAAGAAFRNGHIIPAHFDTYPLIDTDAAKRNLAAQVTAKGP